MLLDDVCRIVGADSGWKNLEEWKRMERWRCCWKKGWKAYVTE